MEGVGETGRHGDDAMARFVSEHGDYIVRLLRRFGAADRDLADGSQEVLIAAWRHLVDLQQPHAVRAWLRTVCRRTARDQRRRAHRRRELLPERAPVAVVEPSQARKVDADRRLVAVQVAASELSPEQREAWFAHDLCGYAARDIATRAGCATKTVFSRLYAARQRVRKCLVDSGLLSLVPGWRPAGALGKPSAGAQVACAAVVACAAIATAGSTGVLAGPSEPATLTHTETVSEVRRPVYLALAPTRGARTEHPRGVWAAIPTPTAQQGTMEFDVFDVLEPDARLAFWRLGLLEFEPVVLGAEDALMADGPVHVGAGIRPQDVRPKLVRAGHRTGW